MQVFCLRNNALCDFFHKCHKDTDHLVCLIHVRTKFVEDCGKTADMFLGSVNWLFCFEREHDKKKISDEERTR